jgi:hypothetical protein
VVVVVVVVAVVVVDPPPRVKREGAGPTGQAVPLPRVMYACVTLCWPSCHEMVFAHTPSNTDATCGPRCICWLPKLTVTAQFQTNHRPTHLPNPVMEYWEPELRTPRSPDVAFGYHSAKQLQRARVREPRGAPASQAMMNPRSMIAVPTASQSQSTHPLLCGTTRPARTQRRSLYSTTTKKQKTTCPWLGCHLLLLHQPTCLPTRSTTVSYLLLDFLY